MYVNMTDNNITIDDKSIGLSYIRLYNISLIGTPYKDG